MQSEVALMMKETYKVINGQDFYVFDAEKNSWKELPSMIYPHGMYHLKLVHLNGFIYVTGGYSRGNLGWQTILMLWNVLT